MKYVKKADIIYIFSLIAVLLVSTYFMYSYLMQPVTSVVVEMNGEIYGVYPLDEDAVIDINDGGNELTVKNNTIQMTHANCPDGLCTAQGVVDNNVNVIVCLPNQVLAYIDGEIEQSEVDVVVQ